MFTRILCTLSVAAVLTTIPMWAYANEAPEVICIEKEPVMICSEPRDLEQGSGTVKTCEMVRQIVCESVEVER